MLAGLGLAGLLDRLELTKNVSVHLSSKHPVVADSVSVGSMQV